MTSSKNLELITPEDSLAIFRYSTARSIHIANALYKVYEANHELYTQFDTMRLLSFIYDTGRIQGIREERAKRKNKT